MSRQLIVASFLIVTLVFPLRASAQISDERLGAAAITAVRGYSSLTIFDDITVTVSDRAITLTGAVTALFKRDEICTRVAKIDGARSVTDNIHVLPVSPTDASLRIRIAQAIYTHPAFWHYAAMAIPPIHIIVEHGHVDSRASSTTRPSARCLRARASRWRDEREKRPQAGRPIAGRTGSPGV